MTKTERVFQFLFRLLAAVTGILCALLFLYGLTATVVFRQFEQNDYPDVVRLNPLFVLAVFLAVFVLLGILLHCLGVLKKGTEDRAPLSVWRCFGDKFSTAGLVWAAGVCAVFLWAIRGIPTNDAILMDLIVQEFRAGDYSKLTGDYLTVYPFQLSYCLITEWLMRLFGEGRFLAAQLLNFISILLAWTFLYKTAWELTEDPRTAKTCAVFSSGFFVLFVYSTYIYNDIWSLAPLFGGFYFLLRFLKHDRLTDGFIAAVLTAFSFFLKSNGTIAMIAAGVTAGIAALSAIGRKDLRMALFRVLFIAVMAVCALGLRSGVNHYYETVSGKEVPGGVPATAYFAMGMQETDGKYGWYNGLNAGLMKQYEGDRALADQAAREEIRLRLAYFGAHPREMVSFYAKKFLSQWGDPTKAALREQELTCRREELAGVARKWSPGNLREFLTVGAGYHIMQGEMHIFHLLLYFFAACACFSMWRKGRRMSEGEMLLLVFAFGGMLFHEIWEASGRYTLRYELALLPIAAQGAVWLYSLLAPVVSRRSKHE